MNRSKTGSAISSILRQPDKLAKVFRGCRVLDYVEPKTHHVVPRVGYLLSSRAGLRYDTGQKDICELFTIREMLLRCPELANVPYTHKQLHKQSNGAQKVWTNLHQRLGSASNAEFNVSRFVDCILAKDLPNALEVIRSADSWPAFVLLHTFARHCPSPADAYSSAELLERVLPKLPLNVQFELTLMAIGMAQQHIPDLIPSIVKVFLAQNDSLDARIANELLWRIAKYGKQWNLVDIPLVSRAQSLVVQAVGANALDAKGVFSLCYIEHFRDPTTALKFMEEWRVQAREPVREPSLETDFAYTAGPTALEILTAPTAAHAMLVADRASEHRAALYACAAQSLACRKELSSDVARKLFDRALQLECFSARLAELCISAVPSFANKLEMLAQARKAGLDLTPTLVSAMARTSNLTDLLEFQECFKQYLHLGRVQQQVLQTMAFVSPEHLWEAYKNAKHPSRELLTSLCRAAWDPKLVWDGMYASQRASAEVQQHVRGIAAPADDVLRLYPSEQLVFAYIVMLGRSGYKDSLLNFVAWMDRLELVPSKRVLLALVYFSPQGPALRNMQLPGWPTEDEHREYEAMLSTQ